DAEKGIVIATNSPVHIDLLLTDIRLPGMNGVELSKQLEARLPSLKTLYMSAYAVGMIDSLSVNGRKVNIIAKPFTIKDLLAAVQQALAPTCSVVSGRQV
ncbi:MAG: response regulator, partial [Chlorobiales bacterium]|nr:response regulator [Chlorobiales bacterium]